MQKVMCRLSGRILWRRESRCVRRTTTIVNEIIGTYSFAAAGSSTSLIIDHRWETCRNCNGEISVHVGRIIHLDSSSSSNRLRRSTVSFGSSVHMPRAILWFRNNIILALPFLPICPSTPQFRIHIVSLINPGATAILSWKTITKSNQPPSWRHFFFRYK